MRGSFIKLHRWAGLLIAVFLIFSGLTGAVISWDHELDDLLNPELTKTDSTGPHLSSFEIARRIEEKYPQVSVGYLPLAVEAGDSFSVIVNPRVNPDTKKLYEPGFNQIFIDPVTGREIGKRHWGAVWPITKENFVSFLFKLHYTLQFPEMFGTDKWGVWLLGIIAIIWTMDCFVGFYITLPMKRTGNRNTLHNSDLLNRPHVVKRSYWQRWKPSWKIRWKAGKAKLNFDLHRAFGLWTWILLFVLAFTAFSLNLYREVFFPAMSHISKVTPTPFDLRKPKPNNQPIEPTYGYKAIYALALKELHRQKFTAPVGAISYTPVFGIYQVRLFHPEDEHGAGGVGPIRMYYDGLTGEYLGSRVPWKGTAADMFLQAQFPVHSGRILGLPGRILISLMGVVVAMLSVTGVIIWWRKSRSRNRYLIQQDKINI